MLYSVHAIYDIIVAATRHQNGRCPWCRRQRKYLLSDVQDLLLNHEILHFRCCPSHHPSKIETCYGHVCLLAVCIDSSGSCWLALWRVESSQRGTRVSSSRAKSIKARIHTATHCKLLCLKMDITLLSLSPTKLVLLPSK